MALILHDYIVLLAKQTPVKDGFSYEKAVIQLSELTEDELHKLFGEATNVTESLKEEIIKRNWKK